MIRGWAISEESVEQVEVFIDGEYAFDVPYGDPRADVGKAFPDISGSSTSGFSVPFRYSTLSAGQHTVSVVVTDKFGAQVERSSIFEVVRFEKSFISEEDSPYVNWSRAESFGDSVRVYGVLVGDVFYDIVLRWEPRSQTYEMVQINKQ